MEMKEFKEKFKELNITLKLAPPLQDKNYKTFIGLKKFVEAEAEFWSSCTSGLCNTIRSKYVNLESGLKSIHTLVEKETNWNAINPQLNQYINTFNGNVKFNLTSKHDCTVKLLELHDNDFNMANGFFKFINGENINSTNKELHGALEAYNYQFSSLSTRKVHSYEEIMNQTSQRYISAIDDIENRYENNTSDVESYYNELKSQTESWKNDKTEEVDIYIKEKQTVIKELEELYSEKLKLQSPAKYWEELEGKFKKEGFIWLLAAVASSIVFIIFLTVILYDLPSFLQIDTKQLDLEALRGVLLLTIIISIGVYLIRLFVKMSMSAYHLSRDSKERHQLSYFYLALIKDEAIQKEDRTIVLQSLFSRSDTGLIKGDSSPSFPVDSMLAQVFKNIAK